MRKKTLKKRLYKTLKNIRKKKYNSIQITMIITSVGILIGLFYFEIMLRYKLQDTTEVDQKLMSIQEQENNSSRYNGEDMAGEVDGDSTMRSAKFVKLENGAITYIDTENKTIKVPIPSEQLMLQCSKVGLTGRTEYNFKNSYLGKITTPDEVKKYLKPNDDILVIYDLATYKKTDEKIIAVIVHSDDCLK
jgi:hypothetical protein